MQIKRVFNPETNELLYLKIVTHQNTQKFIQETINTLMEDGFLSMSKGVITVHGRLDKDTPLDLNYKVIRKPGYYCCHDEKLLAGEEAAREYVAKNYPDTDSPDPQNPAGYRKDDFFYCELIEENEEAENA